MRGPRICYPNAILHVINRFVDKHPFFNQKDDFNYFLDVYFETAQYFYIKTYAYCLMSNHFHIVLKIPTGEISKFLQRFLTKVSKSMNKRKNRVGHLFQGRSKTLIVQEEKYFSTLIEYVLLNPVKAGICKNVFEYLWNSVNDMLNKDSNRLSKQELWQLLFSKNYNVKKIHIVKNWLKKLNLDNVVMKFNKGHKGSFLSDKEFREDILSYIGRRKQQTKKIFGRRKTDVKIKEWNWQEIDEIVKNISIKKDAILAAGWRTISTAKEQIRWYIEHEVARWTWEKIRQIEYKRNKNITISRMSVAISRLKSNADKMKIINNYLNVEMVE